MATENLNDGLPSSPTTLLPTEHLRFLEMIERAELPPGTRGYLVTRTDDGARTIRPVPEGASIVRLRGGDDLVHHLDAAPVSDEVLEKLRDHCVKRLAERGSDAGDFEVSEARRRLALEAAWELEQIGNDLLQRSQGFEDFLVRGMAMRTSTLACVVMSAIDDELDNEADISYRLTGIKAQAA